MATQLYQDFISSMESGVNSGVEPLLLAKNQLAQATNCSVRGAYVTHRPPVIKKVLDFGGSTTLQSLVQNGVFQGAGYYRPDYGTESLLASISGHIFKFTENGNSWGVTDISVPNDFNDSAQRQCWIWQSEKWMIVSDGSGKLPIFFDGTNSRRSLGDTTLWGTTNAAFTPPAIGSSVTLTLTGAYTGLYNMPVILNGEYYQPTVSTNIYSVSVQNLTGKIGSSIPAGSLVIVNPNILCVGTVGISAVSYVGGGTSGILNASFTAVSPNNLYVGQIVNLDLGWGNYPVNPFTIFSINGTSIVAQSVNTYQVPFGAYGMSSNPQPFTVSIPNGTAPSVSLGTVEASVVVSSGFTLQLSSTYTGNNNQLVQINNDFYLVSVFTDSPTGTVLNVINLTDTTIASVHAGATIMSVPELPAGRMGAYGQGRNWMSGIDGLTFMGADIIGGGAGTPANDYRDSVLKNTENTFLSGGGSFRLPGAGEIITAMVFPAILDASLGQGALEVSTSSTIFSCNVPVDRSTWETMTSPVLSVTLKDRGALGQWSTISVNSDTMFRGWDGLGSLILARRDFSEWGNMPISQKPISNEMQIYLGADDLTLLSYGSSCVFDNRYLTTLAPTSSGQGVFHEGLVSMNLDTVSNLQQQLPPVYDGLWTGLNVLQVKTGIVNGKKRCFAFCLNLNLNQIELYEFMQATTTSYWDNDTTPIVWDFNLPVAFNKDVKPLTELCQLKDGEVYLKDIKGDVHVEVYYKPDYYPIWTLWNEFDVSADVSAPNSQPGYRTRIGLGEPDVTPCEVVNNRPLRNGYFFQFRYVITGSAKWMGMRTSAVQIAQPSFAPMIQ